MAAVQPSFIPSSWLSVNVEDVGRSVTPTSRSSGSPPVPPSTAMSSGAGVDPNAVSTLVVSDVPSSTLLSANTRACTCSRPSRVFSATLLRSSSGNAAFCGPWSHASRSARVNAPFAVTPACGLCAISKCVGTPVSVPTALCSPPSSEPPLLPPGRLRASSVTFGTMLDAS